MEIKGGIKSLKLLFSGDKRVRLIVALGLLGMVLILISQFASSPDKKRAAAQEEEPLSTEAYVESMEKKLCGLIGRVEGVGKAQVMITLESSAQMVYATEDKTQTDRMKDVSGTDKQKEQQSDNTQFNYVLVDQGSGQKQPLVKARLEPTVKGVVVVCPGADSKVVNARIVEVVTTALGVGANKVCVVKGDA